MLTCVRDLGNLVTLKAVPSLIASCIHKLVIRLIGIIAKRIAISHTSMMSSGCGLFGEHISKKSKGPGSTYVNEIDEGVSNTVRHKLARVD